MAKFLLDQDIYGMTAKFLDRANYDVVSAAQLGLSRAKDTEVLRGINARRNEKAIGKWYQ